MSKRNPSKKATGESEEAKPIAQAHTTEPNAPTNLATAFAFVWQTVLGKLPLPIQIAVVIIAIVLVIAFMFIIQIIPSLTETALKLTQEAREEIIFRQTQDEIATSIVVTRSYILTSTANAHPTESSISIPTESTAIQVLAIATTESATTATPTPSPTSPALAEMREINFFFDLNACENYETRLYEELNFHSENLNANSVSLALQCDGDTILNAEWRLVLRPAYNAFLIENPIRFQLNNATIDETIHLGHAFASYAKSDFESAVDLFRDAVSELSEELAWVSFMQGNSAVFAGQYDEAARAYLLPINSSPELLMAAYNNRLFAGMNRALNERTDSILPEFIDSYDMAIIGSNSDTLARETAYTLYALNEYLILQNNEDAQTYCKALETNEPVNASSLRTICNAMSLYFLADDAPSMISETDERLIRQELNRAIAQDRNNAYLYFWYANILSHQANFLEDASTKQNEYRNLANSYFVCYQQLVTNLPSIPLTQYLEEAFVARIPEPYNYSQCEHLNN